MFFVSRGNKGVTGEWRVRRGNKGLRRKWRVKGEEKPKTRVAESATRGTQGKALPKGERRRVSPRRTQRAQRIGEEESRVTQDPGSKNRNPGHPTNEEGSLALLEMTDLGRKCVGVEESYL
jgi:hypothetical protein